MARLYVSDILDAVVIVENLSRVNHAMVHQPFMVQRPPGIAHTMIVLRHKV